MELLANGLCPDEERVADYLEDRLSLSERAEMEAHLSACGVCLDEFLAARSLASADLSLHSAPADVTDETVRLVKDRISTGRDPSAVRLIRTVSRYVSGLKDHLQYPFFWKWSASPTRGPKTVVSPDVILIRKAFKGVLAEIEIEKTAGEKAHIRIRLGEGGDVAKGLRVTLKKGDREISSLILNGGYGVFEDIPFGQYNL
ncbi:MAG: zf-HC2 domain-containing protein, partial [Desulfobacterota bacterium]|nr:zf-HC2 domain-containing protein [Thermodesulfobacteriota bacterium]